MRTSSQFIRYLGKWPQKTLAVLGFGLAASLSSTAYAASFFNVSSGDPAAIQGSVNNFRLELGDLNAPAPENNPDGRRQIDWDAAPDVVSDPNAFPGDFFNFSSAPRARGIEFSGSAPTPDEQARGITSATGFALSSTASSGQPVEFGFPDQFTFFSPERLFAPTGGTAFDVRFFDPVDQSTPALVTGFGAVFTNVLETFDNITIDNFSFARMEFFDVNGQSLAVDDVRPTSGLGGMSFLGRSFDDAVISRVRITAGTLPIDTPGIQGTFSENFLVAMDDFIFGEPIPQSTVAAVPLPAAGWLLLFGAGALRVISRKR